MKILVKKIVTQSSYLSNGDFHEPNKYTVNFQCIQTEHEALEGYRQGVGNSTYQVNYNVITVGDIDVENKQQFLQNFQQYLNETYSSNKIESKKLQEVLENSAEELLKSPAKILITRSTIAFIRSQASSNQTGKISYTCEEARNENPPQSDSFNNGADIVQLDYFIVEISCLNSQKKRFIEKFQESLNDPQDKDIQDCVMYQTVANIIYQKYFQSQQEAEKSHYEMKLR